MQLNTDKVSTDFQIHIIYDKSIRAIDLENSIRAIRLFVQNEMREDTGESIKQYTNYVQISSVEHGSIKLNFKLYKAISTIALVTEIAANIAMFKSSDNQIVILQNQEREHASWINTAIRDLNTAINNGVHIYFQDADGNVVDINNGNIIDKNQVTLDIQVGDQVQLKSGGPIMTIQNIENEMAHCIYFDDSMNIVNINLSVHILEKV